MQHDKVLHFSVGAVIERAGKYLLIDRATPPFGFASIAGHIDENESPEQALAREIKEESGLTLLKQEKLFEEELDRSTCNRGVARHYWHVFSCTVTGDVKRNKREAKSIGWFATVDIAKLPLEPVWEYWFKKMNVLPS